MNGSRRSSAPGTRSTPSRDARPWSAEGTVTCVSHTSGSRHAFFSASPTFHGGIDRQHLVPNGTAEELTAETRRLIGVLAAGGG